jgi:inosine/xanthosine triphosphatase
MHWRKRADRGVSYVSGMAVHTTTDQPSAWRLPEIRRVIVGSENPVKIAAVRAVLARCAPDVIVVGAATASGVPDQPWGDAETRAGATERARGALRRDPDADLGVGIEGGVVREADGSVMSCAWAAVVDGAGMVSVGGSLALPLPPAVVSLLDAGVELGHAMDQVAGTVGTKHGGGAVGLLTAGLISRQEAYEQLVTYALSRWLGRALWVTRNG